MIWWNKGRGRRGGEERNEEKMEEKKKREEKKKKGESGHVCMYEGEVVELEDMVVVVVVLGLEAIPAGRRTWSFVNSFRCVKVYST